jgi:hypothetical protein
MSCSMRRKAVNELTVDAAPAVAALIAQRITLN